MAHITKIQEKAHRKMVSQLSLKEARREEFHNDITNFVVDDDIKEHMKSEFDTDIEVLRYLADLVERDRTDLRDSFGI